MDITTVRTQLATAAKTITGMRSVLYVPEKVEPPVTIVSVGSGTYDEDFAGSMTVTFSLLVLVSRADVRSAQAKLNDYIDPTGALSVKAAVEADPTLSSNVSSVAVLGWSEPQEFEIASTSYLGIEFDVEVAD